MAFINWSEEFTTGIESIDDQHRHLVDLVNKFEEASRRGTGSAGHVGNPQGPGGLHPGTLRP